jgi:fructokinase
MIVVCGEALIDLSPTSCGKEPGYVPHPGGSPFNVAVALGRLEAPVAFLGRLSRDFFGQRLRGHLVANAVDLRYVGEGPEPTTLAFVHLDEGHEAQYVFWSENSADRKLSPVDLPPVFAEEDLALHFGSFSLVLEPVATTLELCMRREHGSRVISLDPNVRPGLIADGDAYRTRLDGWVGLADLVKISRADLDWLYPGERVERSARRWLELGAGLVVVTMGAEGSIGFGQAEAVHVPGSPVQVVDTVGAGDAFSAGLLAWLHREGKLKRQLLERLSTTELLRLLTYANRVSALACTRAGADPPYRSEVEAGLHP